MRALDKKDVCKTIYAGTLGAAGPLHYGIQLFHPALGKDDKYTEIEDESEPIFPLSRLM